MGYPIDKKLVLQARYQIGTILELTKPLNDPYTPKGIGARMQVEYIDDALQIHGSWLSPDQGSIALIWGVDEFKIVQQE